MKIIKRSDSAGLINFNNRYNNKNNNYRLALRKQFLNVSELPKIITNNKNIINNNINNNNNKNIVNNNINNNNKNDIKDTQLIFDEKKMEIHVKLWEELLNIENYVDNKSFINNHIRKLLNLMEKEFIQKNKNFDIFQNSQLNKIYSKIIKVYFVLITYIKFLLVDFNYEMTIKSNIKRLLSSISNLFLLLLISFTSNENFSFLKSYKEFNEVYLKLIKCKKIKKTKDTLSVFCTNMLKNIDISIYIIKQFSNNFFKVGYFMPIHSILIDIFLIIDTYTIPDIAEIIIKGILFYLIHSPKNEKKNTATTPNMISIGGAGGILSLGVLGFVPVPSPYLKKLPQNLQNTTYTLVLDLDETLVHFFFTPSGGTFLIRPYCFKFLEEMKKIFEIVIFTAATKDYADSILNVIDPKNKFINHRLYRSHTIIYNFTFVKDLSKIGRDLNRTLIVDNLADNFKLQPNNGIQIGTWTDDMKDTQLNDLGNILNSIIDKKPKDIRIIIKKLNDEINRITKNNNVNLNPFKDFDVNKLFK